jgi:hypothetical protein
MTSLETDPEQGPSIGKAFENYALKFLFRREDFIFLERVPDYTRDWDLFALNALKPDFKFRDKNTGQEFYVEVKFRQRYKKCNEIRWARPSQLSRYMFYNRSLPTFLLIGIGDDPECPSLVALIPLEQACYTRLFIKRIKLFEIPASKAVRPEVLWNLQVTRTPQYGK